MSSILGVLAGKILDIVFKRSRDAEKQQDIELKQQDIQHEKMSRRSCRKCLAKRLFMQ